MSHFQSFVTKPKIERKILPALNYSNIINNLLVNVGSGDGLVSKASEIANAQIIGHENHNVRLGRKRLNVPKEGDKEKDQRLNHLQNCWGVLIMNSV